MGNRFSSENFNAALQDATCSGDAARVRESLAAGADVDTTFTFRHDRWFYESATPLMLASALGHVDVVEELLFSDADLHATDSLGYKPIHQACRHGHLEVVKLLVANGAHANPPHSARKWSPLHIASCWNHLPVVHWLVLCAQANLCAMDKHGRRPLDVARRFKASREVIEFLEEHTPGGSSSTDAEGNEGITDPLLAELSANILSQAHQTVLLQRLRFFLVGEMAAGKTSLLRALLGERFVADLESTVGMTVTRTSTHLSMADVMKCPLLKNATDENDVIAERVAWRIRTQSKCADDENNSKEEGGDDVQRPSRELLLPRDRSTAEHKEQKDTAGMDAIGGDEAVVDLLSDVDADKINNSLLAAVSRALATVDQPAPGCVVDMFDCGGQLTFALTHSVCLNPKDAIFLLVFDASKSLDACGDSCFRREGHRDTVPCLSPSLTHLDFLLLWMSTIAMLSHRDGVKPIVMVVGTHLDLVPCDSRQAWCDGIRERLGRELSGQQLRSCLDWRGPYFVDNHPVNCSDRDCCLNDMAELQIDLAQDIAEKFLPRDIKVKWLKAEQVLRSLSKSSSLLRGCQPFRRVHWLLVELGASTSKAESVELLEYLHCVGAVLFFKPEESTSSIDERPVFLSVEWLAQQAAEVLQLTMKPLQRRFTCYQQEVLQLVKRKGLIPRRLLDDVIWPDLSPCVRDLLAKVMESFGLFLPFRFDGEQCFFAPGCVTRTDLGPVSPMDRLQFPEQLPSILLLLKCPLIPYVFFLRILSYCLERFQPTHYDVDIQSLRMQMHDDCFCAELHYQPRGIVLDVATTARDHQLQMCGLPTLAEVARELLTHVQSCLLIMQGQNFPGLEWRFAFRCASARDVDVRSDRHHWVPISCRHTVCTVINSRPVCWDVSCNRAQAPPSGWHLWLVEQDADGLNASHALSSGFHVPGVVLNERDVVKVAPIIAVRWEDIAFMLGFSKNQVDMIKMEHACIVDRCKEMMFTVRQASGAFPVMRLLGTLEELQLRGMLADVEGALESR